MTPTTSSCYRNDSYCHFVLRVGVAAVAEELAVYRVYGGDVVVVGTHGQLLIQEPLQTVEPLLVCFLVEQVVQSTRLGSWLKAE